MQQNEGIHASAGLDFKEGRDFLPFIWMMNPVEECHLDHDPFLLFILFFFARRTSDVTAIAVYYSWR